LTNININNYEEIFVTTTGREATNRDNNDRQLQTNSNSTTDNNSKADCVETKVANPPWLAVFYAIGVIYMFLALAIVCDEFFVPALEEISSDHHLNLSMDVAGATLMAAGGSAPELFTSFVGTFQQSDIGIGTIVGSAVFNVLFVIGCCSMMSKEVLTLTWWPLFRDSVYYTIGLLVLSILVGVIGEGTVVWWEALTLLLMYVGYVLLMWYNRRLYKKLTGKELVLAGEEVDGEGGGGEDGVEEDDGADNKTAATASATASGTATSAEAVMENGEGGCTKSSIAVETDGSLKNGDDVNNNDNNNDVNELLASPVIVASPRSSVPRNDFRWPNTFRAGVLKLLLHPESWVEKGGLGIVSKIQGDVDTVFKKIDTDNSGAIDREELKQLFLELGHEISDDEFDQVFQALDLDGNGTVSK
jgi:K+-dependent Na+/Ca+ exchanger-like protein